MGITSCGVDKSSSPTKSAAGRRGNDDDDEDDGAADDDDDDANGMLVDGRCAPANTDRAEKTKRNPSRTRSAQIRQEINGIQSENAKNQYIDLVQKYKEW